MSVRAKAIVSQLQRRELRLLIWFGQRQLRVAGLLFACGIIDERHIESCLRRSRALRQRVGHLAHIIKRNSKWPPQA